MFRSLLATVLLAAVFIVGGYLLENGESCTDGTGAPPAGAEATALPEGETAKDQIDNAALQDGPYYFIAIHCEPYNGHSDEEALIAQDYQVLRDMVARADEYDIKLTLMFTPEWADYIAADEERLAEVRSWQDEGHEIAAHHHSIWHGNWDGYTDYPEEVYKKIRSGSAGSIEPYRGTLDDFTDTLRQINPDIDSGCLNEEYDKAVMPDAFIYGSCSGYANNGEPGGRTGKDDRSGKSGINEFIVTGEWDGIQRWWLTHYRITNGQRETEAESALGSMEAGVYGVVTHSKADQADPYFYDFLEYLHRMDPEGAGSVTLSQVMEQQLLPEEHVDVVKTVEGEQNPLGQRHHSRQQTHPSR